MYHNVHPIKNACKMLTVSFLYPPAIKHGKEKLPMEVSSWENHHWLGEFPAVFDYQKVHHWGEGL
jgi:hypothetical protein